MCVFGCLVGRIDFDGIDYGELILVKGELILIELIM